MSLVDRIRANVEAAPWVVLEVQNLETELKKTRQNNWQLCNAIIEYHDAMEAVLSFTRNYLKNGGDPSIIPKAWSDLEAQRRSKYKAMIDAAKGAANELG